MCVKAQHVQAAGYLIHKLKRLFIILVFAIHAYRVGSRSKVVVKNAGPRNTAVIIACHTSDRH